MMQNRYEAIGFAGGNTLLAFIAIFIGIPAPFFLWYYGPALRKRSPYARTDIPISVDNHGEKRRFVVEISGSSV